MTECKNIELKERLPELAADSLEQREITLVEKHVAECESCASELILLRDVRASVIPIPFMNVSRIVQALPAAPIPVRDELPWFRRASLQLAAALTLVAGGLIGVRQAGNSIERASSQELAVSAQSQIPSAESPPPAGDLLAGSSGSTSAQAQAAPRTDIALVSGLDDLSTQEMTMLLEDMDSFSAVPVAEPEQFTPVNASDSQRDQL